MRRYTSIGVYEQEPQVPATFVSKSFSCQWSTNYYTHFVQDIRISMTSQLFNAKAAVMEGAELTHPTQEFEPFHCPTIYGNAIPITCRSIKHSRPNDSRCTCASSSTTLDDIYTKLDFSCHERADKQANFIHLIMSLGFAPTLT